jgi:hypothetical protein
MTKPVNSTHIKNTHELSRLEGEELHRKTERVVELLRIANQQQNDPRYAGTAISGSLAHEPAGGAKGDPRDTMQSSPPYPSWARGSLSGGNAGSSRRSRQRQPAGQHTRSGQSRPPSRYEPEHAHEQPAARRLHYYYCLLVKSANQYL